MRSTGGKTAEAAKVADMAIRDMADNANKMGTDLESLQQTYQSIARGNYGMLDNLKLGYGGTRKEMERLLQDAGKLTGKKYDINNLNDVYKAIHVIQQDLGITGTTAKEAEKTVSGSFNALKSAATNLMGDLALGRNVKPAMEALIQSAGTFLFKNLIPMIGTIVKSIPSAIVALLKKSS